MPAIPSVHPTHFLITHAHFSEELGSTTGKTTPGKRPAGTRTQLASITTSHRLAFPTEALRCDYSFPKRLPSFCKNNLGRLPSRGGADVLSSIQGVGTIY